MINRFWNWYERHYTLNVTIAAALFVLQIVHLVWLAGEVIAGRLAEPIFVLDGGLRWPLVLVDYTEVPALLSVSLVYLNELRKTFNARDVAFLLLLNTQWLHIFWITDEFVVSSFQDGGETLPTWLVWVAILIDYLEVPVIADTVRRMIAALREQRLSAFLRDLA
jgi:hypothetical protein